MRDDEVRAARLRNLLLAGHAHETPAGVVEWLGALQAQDLGSAMWSLGVRLPGSNQASIADAFERGEILRTWPMRGTIHVIPSGDADWMLALTGTRSLDTALRRREQLGLSTADADRAVAALESALAGGRRLTRAQAMAAMNEAGVATDGQRGYHLLVYAAQLGVTCIGPQEGAEQTFVLLHEWAPRQTELSRSEALVELAHRYFRSHGPTTVHDFAGWTGLTLTDARTAVAGNDGRLVPAGAGPDARWTGLGPPGAQTGARVLVLPGFDELILGFKDRSLHVPDGEMDRIVPGGNGVFRATVVLDGVVRATWRRTLRPGRVDIVVEPFAVLGARTTAAAKRAFRAYADYLGREPVVRFEPPAPPR